MEEEKSIGAAAVGEGADVSPRPLAALRRAGIFAGRYRCGWESADLHGTSQFLLILSHR